MKRGYYIYFRANVESAGVAKKVDGQIRALNLFFDCQKLVICREKYKFIKSIMWRMPFGSFGRQYSQAWGQIENPDFFYIRFVQVDRKLLQFIKELRIRFPKCKILMEIATYPYVHEWTSKPSMLPFYIKDMWYHRELKKYIDRIVTFAEDETIFGIPTIRTVNGIWVEDVKYACERKDDDRIVLLAVAVFRRAHGYERCLLGLADYYNGGGARLIEIHMVGYGKEIAYYQNLVKKYRLEKYVYFFGKKTGEELERFYKNADIALGLFGGYKDKIYKISTLKTSEYLAWGLPIISGCRENAFDNSDVDFLYQIPNDSTPINMEEVIRFHDKLYKSGETRNNIANRIRDFANRTVDMKAVMKPIVDYLL